MRITYRLFFIFQVDGGIGLGSGQKSEVFYGFIGLITTNVATFFCQYEHKHYCSCSFFFFSGIYFQPSVTTRKPAASFWIRLGIKLTKPSRDVNVSQLKQYGALFKFY